MFLFPLWISPFFSARVNLLILTLFCYCCLTSSHAAPTKPFASSSSIILTFLPLSHLFPQSRSRSASPTPTPALLPISFQKLTVWKRMDSDITQAPISHTNSTLRKTRVACPGSAPNFGIPLAAILDTQKTMNECISL